MEETVQWRTAEDGTVRCNTSAMHMRRRNTQAASSTPNIQVDEAPSETGQHIKGNAAERTFEGAGEEDFWSEVTREATEEQSRREDTVHGEQNTLDLSIN